MRTADQQKYSWRVQKMEGGRLGDQPNRYGAENQMDFDRLPGQRQGKLPLLSYSWGPADRVPWLRLPLSLFAARGQQTNATLPDAAFWPIRAALQHVGHSDGRLHDPQRVYALGWLEGSL